MLVIVIFLVPSRNIGSSPSLIVGAIIFLFSLPSVKVGRSPSVKVGDCYLFATLSECW